MGKPHQTDVTDVAAIAAALAADPALCRVVAGVVEGWPGMSVQMFSSAIERQTSGWSGGSKRSTTTRPGGDFVAPSESPPAGPAFGQGAPMPHVFSRANEFDGQGFDGLPFGGLPDDLHQAYVGAYSVLAEATQIKYACRDRRSWLGGQGGRLRFVAQAWATMRLDAVPAWEAYVEVMQDLLADQRMRPCDVTTVCAHESALKFAADVDEAVSRNSDASRLGTAKVSRPDRAKWPKQFAAARRAVVALPEPCTVAEIIADMKREAICAAHARGRHKDDGQSAVRHSGDYRSVHWHGRDYNFTARQSAVVRVLWDNWQNGTPDVSGGELLAEADSTVARLLDLFRDKKQLNGYHPAWQTMIVAGATKGSYRLKG